jgi:hypothetical protein
VRIEPVQLVRGTSTNRVTQHRLGGNEFDNRLMRDAHRVFEHAAPEKR